MFCLTLSDKKSHKGGKKLQNIGTFFRFLHFSEKNGALACLFAGQCPIPLCRSKSVGLSALVDVVYIYII